MRLIWSKGGRGGSDDTTIAVLEPDEWEAVARTLAWLRERAGADWGRTVPSVRLVPTSAATGARDDLFDVLSVVAGAARYDSGEGLYDEDCPELARIGIPRS